MNKYKNIKTIVDGITFDSKKEANRYIELKLMQSEGEIYDLERQPVFKYMSADDKKVLFKYIADFKYKYLTPGREYDSAGNVSAWYANEVVEDVKSSYTAKLPVFRLKQKLIEDRFGFKIVLI